MALVTGSSSGLGLAIAHRLGKAGARVVVNSRTEERARQTAEALREDGIEAEGIAADVSDPAQVTDLVACALARFGRIDILVNNAGRPSVAPAEDLSIEEWQTIIATDLSGPFYCAQAAGRTMLAQGSGVIINVSSIFGLTGNRLRAAYVASKHGLEGLTKVLASEWADRGVRVCSINPGYVATALVEQATGSSQTSLDALRRRSPSGRLGLESEIAETVAFLRAERWYYAKQRQEPVRRRADWQYRLCERFRSPLRSLAVRTGHASSVWRFREPACRGFAGRFARERCQGRP
ncbi:SDR family oxidoreductase [Sphingomonas sp. UYEF23]|uniref:SDR family NAD(P)-dependent oxidoreductase n=1 Tax=Sphingomonas sp. UYEF23 TaxID=1756408 RepID=UPI003393DEA4